MFSDEVCRDHRDNSDDCAAYAHRKKNVCAECEKAFRLLDKAVKFENIRHFCHDRARCYDVIRRIEKCSHPVDESVDRNDCERVSDPDTRNCRGFVCMFERKAHKPGDHHLNPHNRQKSDENTECEPESDIVRVSIEVDQILPDVYKLRLEVVPLYLFFIFSFVRHFQSVMNKPQNQKRGILSNLERIERFYFGKNQTLVL